MKQNKECRMTNDDKMKQQRRNYNECDKKTNENYKMINKEEKEPELYFKTSKGKMLTNEREKVEECR